MKHPHELTPEELADLRYGQWTGDPKGTPRRPTQCSEEVWTNLPWSPYQCSRQNGHGPKGLYCKQHAKRFEVKP
jgi:hypothetical protein